VRGIDLALSLECWGLFATLHVAQCLPGAPSSLPLAQCMVGCALTVVPRGRRIIPVDSWTSDNMTLVEGFRDESFDGHSFGVYAAISTGIAVALTV
jgi:hypothetical protein